MLHLRSKTPPEWWETQRIELDALLDDHASCEAKAASTALGLIFRYSQHTVLAAPLSELAREELEHFQQVLARIEARGRRWERRPSSRYASALLEVVSDREPARLVDTLLCCALIEARSCDRLRAIAEGLGEDGQPDLQAFYASLVASEARHFATYTDLARACDVVDAATIQARLGDLATHEAEVIARHREPGRIHG